ncbi:uncharacterized protein [Temnothorax nylanderi]|uniref:uncharacterized protein n=1 Tax=Temnothorax nylanderi TaxID=102681 RepID=UPI003A8AEA11
MTFLFKVWSANRQQKASLILNESENMLSQLITKSNTKLGIIGCTLVMEKDGTVVNDDDVLKFCSRETFILLQQGESWLSPNETEIHSMVLNLEDNPSLITTISECTSDSSFASTSRDTSSPINPLNTTIQAHDEEMWTNFNVPWGALESSVLKELETGNRSKHVINNVVNRTISEMRNLSQFIPSKAFKIIAKKIINKYPQTFKDMDENGESFGDGTYTLYLKLRDRNSYLNRPHMKRCLSQTLNIPLKKQRKVLSAKAGCSNWQPEQYVESETEETIEDKVQFLRRVALQGSPTINIEKDKISSYLEITYPAQRLFLNNVHKPPTIQDVKSLWPILLRKEYMFWHYQKLMGHSISILEENMLKKEGKILSYGRIKKYKDIMDSTDSVQLKATKIIMRHFKEDFSVLFKVYPEGTLLEDLSAPISAPCIVILDDTTCSTFYLFIEQSQIERTHSFYEALEMLISSYFIFNMEYPTSCACTLEFLQKYLLNIHPSYGSKSLKASTKRKVLSLFNKLRDIEDVDLK